MLLSNALRLLDIQVELLFVVGGVHHQEGNEEHALVAALQVFQQLLGFAAIGGQIAGNDVHVISRSDRFLLFLDLHSVEIGDLALHVANGCNLINGLNMDGHDEAGFHGEEIGQAAVIQIRRKDGEEADLALPIAHPEGVLVTEVKAGWNDEVLGRKSGGREPFPVEEEGLGVHVEHIVHEL